LPLGFGDQHPLELGVADLAFRLDEQIGHPRHRLPVPLAAPVAVRVEETFDRVSGEDVAAQNPVLHQRRALRGYSLFIEQVVAVQLLAAPRAQGGIFVDADEGG